MNQAVNKNTSGNSTFFTALCGFCAFSVIITGAIASAWSYSGRRHEPYSFFNHFISELGNRNYSGHAYFFNGAMMTAGIPVILFMTGIYSLLQSRIRYVFLPTGILAGVLCMLVGYYSSDRFGIHIRIALAQFNMMLLSSIFFSLAVLRERDRSYFHRSLAYAGAIPILCIISFLAIEYTHQADVRSGHMHQLLYHRPDFWPLPFMEWMVFFSLVTWIAVICAYLLYISRSNPKFSLTQEA